MGRNNFDKWLDKLVKERNIDVLEVYTIKKDGKSYELTIKQILECLKLGVLCKKIIILSKKY